jgi:hypothetical protein
MHHPHAKFEDEKKIDTEKQKRDACICKVTQHLWVVENFRLNRIISYS